MTRRERLEAKLAKREEWAGKADHRAEAAYNRSRAIVRNIPMGQPVLIGHHSEKRHRRDLEKADNAMRKSSEEAKLAEHHRSKAGGLADQLDSSIYSDDPDAIEQLRQKAAAIEAEVEQYKQINAAYRKHKGAPGWAAGLGLQDPARLEQNTADLMKRCPYERQPVPSYSLANKRAEIRRCAERIRIIEARAKRTEAAEQAGGVIIQGDDYVRVTFAEKPDRDILNALRSAGFQWSGGSWHGYRAKLPESVLQEVNNA